MPKSFQEYSPPKGIELVESLYGGSCDAPFRAPQLLERRHGWSRRIDVYRQPLDGIPFADDGPSSEFLAPEHYLERMWLPCGKCPSCANWRKSKYERAALGWYQTTACTVLGTLTFANSWFAAKSREEHEKAIAALPLNLPHLSDEQLEAHRAALRAEGLPKRYNPKIDRHFRDARYWLEAERTAMLKRMRWALSHQPAFVGVLLKARLEVMELGSRNQRLHLHLLWHFDEVPPGFVRTLRKWLKADWHGKRGVGFVDLHVVEDDEQAIYQVKYLGKFEDAADGRKLYVGSGNPVPQSNGYLLKGYRRLLEARGEHHE